LTTPRKIGIEQTRAVEKTANATLVRCVTESRAFTGAKAEAQ
jgi:hypothetical protein